MHAHTLTLAVILCLLLHLNSTKKQNNKCRSGRKHLLITIICTFMVRDSTFDYDAKTVYLVIVRFELTIYINVENACVYTSAPASVLKGSSVSFDVYGFNTTTVYTI